MAPRNNIEIDQGSTYYSPFRLAKNGAAIDITGYSFRSQIRSAYGDAAAVASFAVNILDGTDGTFAMSMSDTASAALPAGVYLYDMEMVDLSGKVTRLVEGKVKVRPEVTK